MHELSIVQSLLEQVQAEVAQSGHAGRVVVLHLVVGRLSGVHADAIRFGFELLSPNSIANGAVLRIDEPRAQCHCHACSVEQDIEEIVVACPACGSPEIVIRGGQELLLQSIELEDGYEDRGGQKDFEGQ
ncbi:MAG: hydrogenase maturation nickel metallochaperone HypA [Pirellulaceae bacterium]